MALKLVSSIKRHTLNIIFLILILPFFSVAQIVESKSQDTSTTSNTSTTSSSSGNNEGLSRLGSESTSLETVGTFSLKRTNINLYNSKDSAKKNIIIDSVKMIIILGKIAKYSLKVYSGKDDIFSNFDSPISLYSFRKNLDYKLKNQNNLDGTYIMLKEVLKYDFNNDHMPDDNPNVRLDTSKPYYILSIANNRNSLIKVALYTDLIGLLGRKPNGLLNTDISGKFFVNKRNIGKADLTFLSFIEPNIILSKFDSKFKSIDSTYILPGSNNEKDTIDRMRLMQTAWLKASLKFNLFTLRSVSDQYLQLNVGTNINVVNADSLFKNQPSTDIIYFDYYLEPVYLVNRVHNFGMEISMKFILQHIADKEPFSNDAWKYVFNPHIGFSYYPNEDPSKQIFLRFDYFAGHQISDNNFYQLEFGWKTDLTL